MSKIRDVVRKLYYSFNIARLRKRGLQIADDCCISKLPDFGSEPYLISIGSRVGISSYVTFITHDGANHVVKNLHGGVDVRKYGRITVHENCFIGSGVTILPGVSIGPNSVVGANALVVADVPPNTVVGGNPARPLMSIETYAEKLMKRELPFDEARYQSDKVAELLRLLPYPW
jgi:acetyltransferase-like isoleucine patch superfamily enzyme